MDTELVVICHQKAIQLRIENKMNNFGRIKVARPNIPAGRNWLGQIFRPELLATREIWTVTPDPSTETHISRKAVSMQVWINLLFMQLMSLTTMIYDKVLVFQKLFQYSAANNKK